MKSLESGADSEESVELEKTLEAEKDKIDSSI